MLPFCQWGSRGGCRGGSRSPILATSPISRTPLLRDGAVGDCCVEEDEVMSMGGGGEARRAMLMLLVAAVNNTRVPLKSSVLPAPRSLDGCKAARQEFDCATQDLSFSDYVLCFALARKVEEDKNSCTWICYGPVVEGGPVRMDRLPCYRSILAKFRYLLKQRFIAGFFLAAIPWYIGALFIPICGRVHDYREEPGYVGCTITTCCNCSNCYATWIGESSILVNCRPDLWHCNWFCCYKSMGLVTVQSKEQKVRLKVLLAMNKNGVETMRTKIGVKSNVDQKSSKERPVLVDSALCAMELQRRL